MQDAGLLLSLAEIAGVFVGFGALIAVRSGGASGPIEVGYMRGMVAMGVLAIVAAVAPVTLDRLDVAGHQAWALSSGLVLVGAVVFVVVNSRTPEYRANWTEGIADARRRWGVALELAASMLVIGVMVVALVVVVLGLAPDLEAGLYFAVVVLILLQAAWALLDLVYAQRRPS